MLLFLFLLIKLTVSCIPTRSPEDLAEILLIEEKETVAEKESASSTSTIALTTTTETTTSSTTSTTTTITTTTTTTTSGDCITNCPNIESCVGGPGGDIPPGAASCFMSTAMVTKTATGCAFTVDCNSIVPGLPLTAWYKQQSTNMWVNYGSNLMMATCGDTPNNQWKDPMGNVVIKLVCAD